MARKGEKSSRGLGDNMAGRKNGQGSKWIRPEKRLAIYLRDGFCCAYCGATQEGGAVLSLDHRIACELGGDNSEKNLITCCVSCNSAKKDLTTRAWFAVLRERGVDVSKIGPRIRRLCARPLDMEAARAIIASREV